MSSHLPPVPPANRSPKGPGEPARAHEHADVHAVPDRNNTGQAANTRINTTPLKSTQDR